MFTQGTRFCFFSFFSLPLSLSLWEWSNLLFTVSLQVTARELCTNVSHVKSENEKLTRQICFLLHVPLSLSFCSTARCWFTSHVFSSFFISAHKWLNVKQQDTDMCNWIKIRWIYLRVSSRVSAAHMRPCLSLCASILSWRIVIINSCALWVCECASV